jgi:hypothetical protein
MSARLPPEEERENIGWGGRLPMARDCLDPDTDRTWLPPKPLVELDLFMAEAGWGMAEFELRLMPPRVYTSENGVSSRVEKVESRLRDVVPLGAFARSKDPYPAT